jgi:prolyl-tRNA synthetase
MIIATGTKEPAMRLSSLFGQTLREAPADATLASHQLALRAGLIRQVAAGIYAYLPLGWRVLRKLEALVRAEMDAIGGQELSMPVVQPAELWQTSGRYDAPAPGQVLVRFDDRSGHPMVLAMTHEEVATALARSEIRSYRQLPLMIYQVQTKYRDEVRARGGLIRVREFIMKDGYSFHADQADLEAYYPQVYAAYKRLFQRVGLDTLAVQADSGMMGGSASHEFMMLHPDGEGTLVHCAACRYAANAEAATLGKGSKSAEPPAPMVRVATPETTTIASLAQFLGIEARQTAKAVFYTAGTGPLLFAVIRGDLEVNEAKLAAALGVAELRPASHEALQAAGLVPGYASPVGLSAATRRAVRVIVDDAIPASRNLVAGANAVGYHLRNVNYPRDFQADGVADIALATGGSPCPHCGQPLALERGIEVGHVFKLGDKYARLLGATYSDAEGQARPLVMGCYGIGLGRLLACVIEQHHDDQGIIWPSLVAPYQVHLVSLSEAGSEVAEAADALYARLGAQGFEVLYDDRDARAGEKFADADLIGCPVRLTVSRRTLQAQHIECKLRSESERRLLPEPELNALLREVLNHHD